MAKKLKTTIKELVRWIYHSLPIPNKYRLIIKDTIYKSFAFALKDTNMYKAWEISKGIDSIQNQSQLQENLIPNEFLNEVYKEHLKNEYVNIAEEHYEFSEEDIKLIAFYLPQFHPFKENNEWWGKGFTEWTNVTRAVPQYIGHYQPQLPGELGFYDLRILDILKRQAELAKKYGVYGFCFYHYWFNGKRLMEMPVNQLMDNKDIDLPFCLCWANENWTRRWDGMDNEILIAQNYSESDDIEFIKDISTYLKDTRYIKINGKYLILLYRPSLIPNAKETINRWREYCQDSGIGQLYIVGVNAWGCDNASEFGLDALTEFPPHSIHNYGCDIINENLKITNPHFNGIIYDLKSFVENEDYLKKSKEKMFRCVCPSWDNTARRLNNATILHNSNPKLYQEWLEKTIKFTNNNFNKDERVVFINAWNEWAEGAHLEPDSKYGYGYLQATFDALENTKTNNKNIILVSHDAHFNGAQILALNIVKQLKQVFGYHVYVLLKSGGELEDDFKKYSKRVINLEGYSTAQIEQAICAINSDIAICNTVITGDIVKIIHNSGKRCISLIHELPNIIKQYHAENKLRNIIDYADKIIFPSEFVKNKLSETFKFNEDTSCVFPQGLFHDNEFKGRVKEARKLIREELDIPKDSRIILGVGYGDHRKGIDLFVETASIVTSQYDNTFFVWIGGHEPQISIEINNLVKEKELEKNILFIKPNRNISKYYAGSDIYLMTSREDPFPSVVLESMNVAIPVIGFNNAGGFKDIVTEKTGVLVDYLDIDKMSETIIYLLKNEKVRLEKGKNSQLLIEEKFNFIDYIYFLVSQLTHPFKKVSVVLPNYNYEKYLTQRIKSILNQTYPIYEIIFLDDCSTDDSLSIAEKYFKQHPLRFKIIKNNRNSQSVFRQWEKGIVEAEGDFIWIAEADDYSDIKFLEENMKSFQKDKVVLSYSQSKQIDSEGNILAESYLEYTNDIDVNKWKNNYFNCGVQEIKECLAIKNTIPNVSAVVFKKSEIDLILEELVKYKIAGDWRFYVWVLDKGDIAYISQPLNYHRRHKQSVTKSENIELHLKEIKNMQDYIKEKFDIEPEVNEKIMKYRYDVERYLLS